MPAVDLVVPGDLATLTGGYVYDARVFEGLARRGWEVARHRLAESFPDPAPGDVAHASRVLAAIGDGRTVVVDGLALGALPEVAHAHARRLRLVALVHHPLAHETGLSPARVERARREERTALAAAAHVVVTSASTARALAAYAVETARMSVVEPGTDRGTLASGSDARAPFELLCVATLTPRKGHAVLLEAVAGLAAPPWRLTCVGSADRDPATTAALRAQTTRLGLEGQVRFTGPLDAAALAASYARADLFVLATFHEGYGMAFAEALAHGLPVVGTTAGAVRETVPPGAGLLVTPGDAQALRAALARVLDDEQLRGDLAAGARTARARLPTWDDACDAMDAVLRRVAGA